MNGPVAWAVYDDAARSVKFAWPWAEA